VNTSIFRYKFKVEQGAPVLDDVLSTDLCLAFLQRFCRKRYVFKIMKQGAGSVTLWNSTCLECANP
jgi:hypothetical protein